MSHRVTTKTEITDRELALSALKSAGVTFRDLGNNKFTITASGVTADLNLATGEIGGDADHLRSGPFDTLKQHYAEQKYVWELRRQGHTVESRQVDAQGNIVIMYQTNG